ncbi:hypothetical protein EB061_04115 [bacterium]|nr:hypothetical protein [bacterium]
MTEVPVARKPDWKRNRAQIARVLRLGLERMKRLERPFLLVLNHNIAAPMEVLSLLSAWENRFQGRFPVYGLAHRFPFRIPLLAGLFRQLGALPATHEAANQALMGGASVAVFPGGNFESVRPFSQRNQCDFGGKLGWIDIAVRNQVPVVPVAISGSHSMNPVLIRSRILSRVLVLPKLLGIRWFPITVGQLVYSALTVLLAWWFEAPLWAVVLSAWLCFLFTVQLPVWPAFIRITIDEPILPEEFEVAGFDKVAFSERVRGRIETLLRASYSTSIPKDFILR